MTAKNQKYTVDNVSSVLNLKGSHNKLVIDLASTDFNNYTNNAKFDQFDIVTNAVVNWNKSGTITHSYDSTNGWLDASFGASAYYEQAISSKLKSATDYTVIVNASSTVSGMIAEVYSVSANQIYNINNITEPTVTASLPVSANGVDKIALNFRTTSNAISGNIYVRLRNTTGVSKTVNIRAVYVYQGNIEFEGLPSNELQPQPYINPNTSYNTIVFNANGIAVSGSNNDNATTLDGIPSSGYLRSPNNLSVYSIGSNDFLDLNVSSNFEGTSFPFRSRGYIGYDNNFNKVYGLRTSTNYDYTSLYYFYFNNDLLTSNDLTHTSTDIEYRPANLLSETEHFDEIISQNEHGFLARVITNNSYVSGSEKYYWVNVNGSMDGLNHTKVDVTSIITSLATSGLLRGYSMNTVNRTDYFALVYCKEKDLYLTTFYTNPAGTGTTGKETYFAVHDDNLTQLVAPTLVMPNILSLAATGQGINAAGAYHTAKPKIFYKIQGDSILIKGLVGIEILRTTNPALTMNTISVMNTLTYSVSGFSISNIYYPTSLSVSAADYDNSFSSSKNQSSYNHEIFKLGSSKYMIYETRGDVTNLRTLSIYANSYEDGFDTNFNYAAATSVQLIPTDSSYVGKQVSHTKLFQDNNNDLIFTQGVSQKYGTVNVAIDGFDSNNASASYIPTSITPLTYNPNIMITYGATASPIYTHNSNYTFHIFNSYNNLINNTPDLIYANNPTNFNNAVSAALVADTNYINEGYSGNNLALTSISRVTAYRVDYIDRIGDNIYYLVSWSAIIPYTKYSLGSFIIYNTALDLNTFFVATNSSQLYYTTANSSFYYINDTAANTKSIVIYKTSANNYLIASSPGHYAANNGGNELLVNAVSANTSFATTVVGTKLFQESGRNATWNQRQLGIHPKYGINYSNSFSDSYLASDVSYYDFTTEPNFETRMINTFTATGTPSVLNNVAKIRGSQGLQIAYDSIECFMNGTYFTIPSNSVTGLLPNTTYYFYVNTNKTVTYETIDYPNSTTRIQFGTVTTDNVGIATSNFFKITEIFNYNPTQAAFTLVNNEVTSGNARDNGYLIMPNGLIMQWGYVTGNASASFPIEFPTRVFSVYITMNNGGTDSATPAPQTVSNTGFIAGVDGGFTGQGMQYFAIGN